MLTKNDPENFVDLAVTSAGAPVTTRAEVRVTALGVDRLAEIKADHLPLIPFGAEADKALAALSPETADRLAALGVISPRNPAQPKAAVKADWSLEVVRSWRQVLPPGKTTPVVVKFVPVVAHYQMVKGDEDSLDDVKAEICLKPQVLNTLRSRLKGNGVWNVTDIFTGRRCAGPLDRRPCGDDFGAEAEARRGRRLLRHGREDGGQAGRSRRRAR